MDAIATLGAAIADTFQKYGLKRPGIAASGGSDSTALLLATCDVAQATKVDLRVASVDHGLRVDAAREVAAVADLSTRLGCPHDALSLNLSPGPNLQARARDARYDALARWAKRTGRDAVLLGHTADDVAETLMMRLGRGAGIDGLARMAQARHADGCLWLRPALLHKRADLRAALKARGQGWCDDPSNEDPTFERVAVRQAIGALGLDIDTLAASAQALDDARQSLATHAADLARQHVREDRGDLLIDRVAFAARHGRDPDPLPRILLAALRWIGGRPYGPRRDERLRVVDVALAGGTLTLAGCRIYAEGDQLRIAREAAACAPAGPTTALWDNRWDISGPHRPGLTVGALGADITQTPWRDTGLPRASLLASPAIRAGERLIAAPIAGFYADWSARTRVPFLEVLIRR